MFKRAAEKTWYLRRIALSGTIHGVVLFALLGTGQKVRVRAYLPGSRTGSRIELSYLPGGSPTPAARKMVRTKTTNAVREAKLLLPPHPAPPEIAPAVPPAQSQSQKSDSANDALGNEDIHIALTTYSPSPKPDLSHLPHGAQGEVVLDVTIDPTGQVADLQILQTLGYGVDGAVANTVRTWKFSPATKDGVPVASVQELHFHYGPV